VGVNSARTVYLVADQNDLDGGEMNGNARMEYESGHIGDVLPLQQFYKFGVWYPVDTGGIHESDA
jgi:hypothetical protein